MRLNLAVKSGVGRSRPLTAERLVNVYPEKAPEGAKSPVVLLGVGGLDAFGTIDTNVRGEWVFNDMLYVVAGTHLYSVNATGITTELGRIDGVDPVMMADNGTQLCIVANPKGFIYTVASGLVEITDADFPGASSVAYLDGYFIFTTPDSAEFFISALFSGTAYDALDFATAESSPDNLLRVFVDHREIWLFGTKSIEVWYNAGNADFPFARIEGAVAERGLGALGTVAKVDNSVYWLDDVGIVRRADKGYVPSRISTHAVEYNISRGTLADCTAFTYIREGHEFYVLTVPEIGIYCYDAATLQWHERTWDANSYAFCYGKHLFGTSAGVFELVETPDEVAEIVFPPVQLDGDRFRVFSVQLDMETGIGGSTEPQVMLATSTNGKTWSNEKWVGFGKIGKYDQRAIWNRLGQYRTCHLKFRISEPVPRAVYAAYAEITRDS